MPRKPLIRSATLPYHITARTNNRERFHCPLERVWRVLTHHAFEITLLYDVQIHAFLLMPNHFHLLMTTPRADLGQVMQRLMQSATATLNTVSGRSGRVFGARYYGSLVGSNVYFAHALKYLYRNPVRAEICAVVQDYEFSTLPGILGHTHSPLPLHYPFQLEAFARIPNETSLFLEWLNRPFLKEHQEAIRKGLRRPTFAPPKGGWKRTLADLHDPLT